MSTKSKGPKKPVIQQLNLDLIRPYWRNPRRSDDSVPFLVASIERYGFNVPMLVDKKHTIICGHTRYRAARQMGLKEVPAIVLDISEARARQLRIVDNKTSELAKWNNDALTQELLAMSELEVVKSLFGGPFWDDLLKPLARDLPEPAPQPEAAPAAEVSDGYDGSQFEVVCPYCGKENIVRPPMMGAEPNKGDGE